MKNLLKKFAGGSGSSMSVQPMINLAAFGKHPGWDDHIPGIGLETEGLANLKQLLYVTGIGGQIDSGGWEKLEAGKRLEGFDHTFLWQRQGQLLLGRLWSSTDRKGRAKYPMVICVESQGISPGRLVTIAGAELEQLRSRCRSVNTAVEVEAVCQDSQGRLRGALLGGATGMEDSDQLPVATRRAFLESPQFGDHQAGLLRILHELDDVQELSAKTRGSAAGGANSGRSRHLRVPAIGANQGEILQLWLEFFRCALPANLPVMLLARAGVEWLDVVVGEPSGLEFFCLQASPLALPLSTLIPYELKPELSSRLQNLTATFLGMPPVSASLGDNRPPPPKKTEVVPDSQSPVSTRPPGRFPVILVVCVVALLLGSVWFFIPSHGPGSQIAATTPPTPSAPVATPVPTAVTSAPATGSTPVPTVPVVSASQQKFDQSLQRATEAWQRGQYQTTVDAAKAALALQPDNAKAAEVQKEAQAKLDELALAQQQENGYQTALQQAQSAFDGKDYRNALVQAQVALGKKPGDSTAEDLAGQAQAKLSEQALLRQQQSDYSAAMQAAQTAFAAKDYATAMARARSALASQAGDSAAQNLLDLAQRMQATDAAARSAQEQFDGLLAAGQAALTRNGYESALSNAEAALALQPESQPARTLKESAQSGAKYQAAVLAGQSALKRSDNDAARQQAEAALAINPTGAEALKLKADAAQTGDVDKIKTLLNNNKYAAALALCNQHSNDPVFADLAGKVKRQELQFIDDQLEVFEVWFGLLAPDKAKSALARAPAQIQEAQMLAGGELDTIQKTHCIANLTQWQNQLTVLNQLDPARAKLITLLIKTIDDHP